MYFIYFTQGNIYAQWAEKIQVASQFQQRDICVSHLASLRTEESQATTMKYHLPNKI